MKKSMALLGALCSLALILACTGCEQVLSDGGNPPPSYVVGDRGPGGGYVFYDKGSNSDGWRYLEAAPADLTGTYEWGAYEKDVGGTSPAIGSGKDNTDLIVAYLNSINETGKAAQAAVAYSYRGKDDWFLPSKDELNLMYQNLKVKGIGGFSDTAYCSSSQCTTSDAWNQYFNYGGQGNNDKDLTYSVRVVRAF